MLTKSHLVYVMHNVLCWERGWKFNHNKVADVAWACERYDGNYSAWEYERLIRHYGLKKLKEEI